MTERNAAFTQWLADLRSGEFPQGIGYLTRISFYTPGETITLAELRTRGVHCCLGVGCYRAVEAGACSFTVDNRGIVAYGHRESVDLLPPEVQVYLGVRYGNVLTELAEVTVLNDDRDYTFPMIADAVEASE